MFRPDRRPCEMVRLTTSWSTEIKCWNISGRKKRKEKKERMKAKYEIFWGSEFNLEFVRFF